MNNQGLPAGVNRGAFVVSCVSSLVDIAWKERRAITNVAINKVVCYTKPVPFEPFGVISLIVVIDELGKTTIPEVQIANSEEEFMFAVNKLRNYTTHVVEALGGSIDDGVGIEYPARTGDQLSRYISVGLSSMKIFSQIVSECVAALNTYFANVGYDPNTVLHGFDRPAVDIAHEENIFQFINSEIVIAVNVFRVVNGQLEYDFNVGLLLSAMRSGKDDSKYQGIRL